MNKLLAKAALVSSIIFLSCFLLVHFINPEFNVFAKTYSDYVFGHFGYLVSLSLVIFALTQFLLIKPTYVSTKSRNLSLLLFLGATGSLLAAIFPTTMAKNLNLIRILHLTGASLQFLFLPLALIKYGSYQGDSKGGFYKNIGLVTLLLFVSFIIFFLSGFDQKVQYFGFIEKIDILLLNLSLIVWSIKGSIIQADRSQSGSRLVNDKLSQPRP